MRLMRVSALVCVLGVSGCANWASIYRPIALEGRGIAIDAKQRSIISGQRGAAVWCAEPSPDALSALGASSAGTVRTPEEQAQLALSLAEQAASIGLRTQSIQLMRDAMYRACEGYLAGGIDPLQFYSLQRRFQNLSLGLLAIEQLTGAVRAEQAALSTRGASGTGDNIDAETASVKAAQEAAVTAEGEYDKALLAERRAKEASASSAKEVETQSKIVEDLRREKKDTKDAEDLLKIKQAELKNHLDAVADHQLLVKEKAQRLLIAREAVKLAQEELNFARQRVRTAASGSAYISPVAASRVGITRETSEAVKSIVNAVLVESVREEGCNNIMEDFRTDNTGKYSKEPGKTVILDCAKVEKTKALTRARQANVPDAVIQELNK